MGAARLHVRVAGKLTLPDGRVAISDAFVNDSPVVVADLPRGEHVAEVLVAQSGTDARVAAARVRLRDEPVTGWRRVGSIAIDSGTAALFDPRIATTLTASNVHAFNETLLDALRATERPTYSVAALSWRDMTFLAFSTGFGDGVYPVFVGTTDAGLPVTVVVDCEVLPWPE